MLLRLKFPKSYYIFLHLLFYDSYLKKSEISELTYIYQIIQLSFCGFQTEVVLISRNSNLTVIAADRWEILRRRMKPSIIKENKKRYIP